ncbi:MAG TPA: cytochrome c maturation protein CcmE [Lautropia sp.]|nr:cytochrome c maturation protein CcmE [Lautropia sp.]
MKPRHKRLAFIVSGVAVLGTAAGLVPYALNSNIVFFYTPTQVAQQEAPRGRHFRIGGLVQPGSVVRDGTRVSFVVTDNAREIPVAFTGSLPDLFKEGKGVVAQGSLGDDGTFAATEVLAKHDENYMPPEAAEALKQAGHPSGVAGPGKGTQP